MTEYTGFVSKQSTDSRVIFNMLLFCLHSNKPHPIFVQIAKKPQIKYNCLFDLHFLYRVPLHIYSFQLSKKLNKLYYENFGTSKVFPMLLSQFKLIL